MSMINKLEVVVRKIILPMDDRLVDVSVGRKGLSEIYVVNYFLKGKIDAKLAQKLISETDILFKMLSPDKKEDFVVRWEQVDEGLDD